MVLVKNEKLRYTIKKQNYLTNHLRHKNKANEK